MKEAERRQTQVSNRRILRCGARPFGARTLVGVPPRLSPKGVSHPKGSASGQVSWDLVCTGVTRLRLSQSREAPPTPVVMPGDMMPKPPGNGVYRPVRGHRPRSAAGEYPRPTASLLSEIDLLACNCIGDTCQGCCHCIYDVPCSSDCAGL